MSINTINSSLAQAIQSTTSTLDVTSGSNAATSSSSSAASSSDTTQVSGPGQLLAKLKQLQQSDPTKFKQVMSKLSDALKTDAQNASDPRDQKMLNDLASKFDAAGQSGDLSSLAPQGAHRGHHHHHGAPPADGSGSPPDGPPAAGPNGASDKWAQERDQHHEQMSQTMSQLLSIVDAG